MFATGARVQEVIDVTINDFRYNGSESIKIVGKGNKARMVPLEKEMMTLLEGYLQEEKSKRVFYNIDDPIFLNRSNTKFTRQGIAYIVKKYAAKARVTDSRLIPAKVHPHIFRHSRAMALLQAGVELIYIRDFLGHYSVSTTEHYARVSNEATRKALMKVSANTNIELPVWQQDNELLAFLKELGG
jgi:site-specific recombinase XerD